MFCSLLLVSLGALLVAVGITGWCQIMSDYIFPFIIDALRARGMLFSNQMPLLWHQGGNLARSTQGYFQREIKERKVVSAPGVSLHPINQGISYSQCISPA